MSKDLPEHFQVFNCFKPNGEMYYLIVLKTPLGEVSLTAKASRVLGEALIQAADNLELEEEVRDIPFTLDDHFKEGKT